GRMLNGMNPGSQTLYIEPKDLSGIPVRSSVGYRTGGNDYDDIDTRFGLQLSRRTRLNMGAVLKNYSGTLSVVEKYRSQKVNIAVDRELGRNWQVRYLLLRNRSDLNLPLFQPLPDYPSLNRLHQKEARYDHGLMVEKGQTFSTTLQLIDYHRELYNRGTTLLDQQQDVTQVLWHGLWRGNISLLSFQAGADWRWSRMKSDAWGGHEQAATGGWGQVAMALAPKGRISAGLRLQKWTDAEWTLLPLVKMRYDVTPDWRWMLWGERIVRPAGFAHLYSSGPFALGQATLRNQRSDLLGLGMNRIFSGGHLFLSVSWSSIKDGIWAEIRQDESIPVYRNQPLQQQASLDLAAEWRLSSWFTFNAASKGMLFQKHEPQNWPNVSAQGYVQINHRFFKNDLDARLRIGCAVQGEQEASMPYYSQYSEETMAVGAVLVPYLHAIFIIKDATLFFSMQNPLNQDYYRVYPYPMPRGLFRWGFVWRFFD
ncbi:hypothetical protein JXO59_00530, partial [candidate division KSB1 bacterium]|nr:hypothetical protein [candidate division KSB1 bacterium]